MSLVVEKKLGNMTESKKDAGIYSDDWRKWYVSIFNDGSIELIKLRAEALDTGHLKLATWGTKKTIDTLRNNGSDPFR
jgi:hypothetical protein